jgi:hypothetical protein
MSCTKTLGREEKIGRFAYTNLYQWPIEAVSSNDRVSALGKHTERYGRKVSGLKGFMVAGLLHGASSP